MIKPLYKNKGSVDDPESYRGVTLLSCIGKLFTAIIKDNESADSSRLFGETLDHIFVLQSLVEWHLHKKKRLCCASVDYEKAFDLVDGSSLWLQLMASGINGRVINVIHNIYENAKSCVRVGYNLSEEFVCCMFCFMQIIQSYWQRLL